MKITSTFKMALCATGFTAFALVGSAQAQVITWSSPQLITDESNVSTAGTELDGIQAWTGGSTLTLADGVVFNGTATSGNNVSDLSGGIIMTTPDSADNVEANPVFLGVPGTLAGTPTLADGSYSSLLTNAALINPTVTSTLTFNNLTIGSTYQVEVWTASTTQPSWGIDLAGNNPVGMAGDVGAEGADGTLAIGTFTATGASMVEDFSGVDYGTSTDFNGKSPTNYGGLVINAVQIRDIADAPEPSTVALIGLGMLGVAFLVRRHRTA